MNCIIVDDEPQARKLLNTYLSAVPGCKVIQLCANAMEAYEAVHISPVDLVFLDIKMPGLSGIDFLKSLAQPPLVILTTAFNKYALEGYELNVVDYLVKPISLPRLLQAIDKAKERLNQRHSPAMSPYFFVKQHGNFCKISYHEVIYFEGMQNYVKVHLQDSRIIIASATMKSLEESLPPNEFIRIHRSYIIALSAIKQLNTQSVVIGKLFLPIGSSYKEELVKAIHKWKII